MTKILYLSEGKALPSQYLVLIIECIAVGRTAIIGVQGSSVLKCKTSDLFRLNIHTNHLLSPSLYSLHSLVTMNIKVKIPDNTKILKGLLQNELNSSLATAPSGCWILYSKRQINKNIAYCSKNVMISLAVSAGFSVKLMCVQPGKGIILTVVLALFLINSAAPMG